MKNIKSIKYFPITLGCVKNQIDMEYMCGELNTKKWIMVYNPESADVIIINTCSFINDAKEESLNMILEMLEIKPVIVTGCLPQAYGEKLQSLIPEVCVFTGTESAQFADRIDISFRKKDRIILLNRNSKEYKEQKRQFVFGGFHTYIKLSEGCDRTCSYCIIPKIRGPYRSRSMNSIIDEIGLLYKKGFREFNLVSEDSSLYGSDNYKKKKLLKLLEAIEKIGFNDAYFRLLYYYPDREIYNIVDFISESKSFIKYIDIPFQHVSSKILRSMKRDIIDPRKICNYIKKKGLIVRSSLMTGFPGEMLSDYIDLKHFIKDGYIDKIGIFIFSPEEGTGAFKMKQISKRTALRRYETLKNISENIMEMKMRERIGETVKAIINISEKDISYGRLIEDMQDTDMELIVNAGNLPLFKELSIKIKNVESMTYIGEVL